MGTDERRRLVLSVEEVARLLGIGRNGAYEAIQRGEIPHLRIGRRIMIPRDRFEEWLREAATTGKKVAL